MLFLAGSVIVLTKACQQGLGSDDKQCSRKTAEKKGRYRTRLTQKYGSSGKRVAQCCNHHSVIHQIAFARRLAYFFCLSKRSIKKKTPDDAGPAGSLVLLASGGMPKTR